MNRRCLMLLFIIIVFSAGCNTVQNSQISFKQETQENKPEDKI